MFNKVVVVFFFCRTTWLCGFFYFTSQIFYFYLFLIFIINKWFSIFMLLARYEWIVKETDRDTQGMSQLNSTFLPLFFGFSTAFSGRLRNRATAVILCDQRNSTWVVLCTTTRGTTWCTGSGEKRGKKETAYIIIRARILQQPKKPKKCCINNVKY